MILLMFINQFIFCQVQIESCLSVKAVWSGLLGLRPLSTMSTTVMKYCNLMA